MALSDVPHAPATPLQEHAADRRCCEEKHQTGERNRRSHRGAIPAMSHEAILPAAWANASAAAVRPARGAAGAPEKKFSMVLRLRFLPHLPKQRCNKMKCHT